MSSIYKKGRDGYYYYQTYVYNPASKKKDKRIFHALGTRDLEEARKKQSELDLQYDEKNHSNSSKSNLLNKYNLKSVSFIIMSVFTIAVLFFFNFEFKKGEPIDSKPIKKIQNNERVMKSDSIELNKITNKSRDPIFEEKLESREIKAAPKKVKPIIPKYKVERVERLSGSFEQGKIYVTINKDVNKESQYLLCVYLKKQYNEFSNILICLYANNRPGIDLANGNEENVSFEEQKQYWLAMYTYNSVEGEYFDDNPSGYLSIY